MLRLPIRVGLTATVARSVAFPVSAQPSLDPTTEQTEFFETTIRPLLADHCYQCHSAQTAAPFGGLRLDSREGLLAGGDTGPALVPGDASASALLQRVQGRPVLMPPTGTLAREQIVALAEWVEMGAPWPEGATAGPGTPDPSEPFDLDRRRRTHWAWQPVRPVAPPDVSDPAWSVRSVDRFIRARLDTQGMAPAGPADRQTLIRRLSFDVRGLPPTPAEVARFVGDVSPDAYEALVDRYLDSSHFGERWARHWMDLVRYSESHGSEGDPDIPEAWRYRDYLIRALNADVPYDQFVREHLAGDPLDEPRIDPDGGLNESIIATAHYRFIEHGYQPVDPWEDRVKWTDNQVDVVSKAFMGLTVSCARCHDHKFDAISQRDYYSLFGTLYGARPTQRAIDAPARLETNKTALVETKSDIRRRLADAWLAAADDVPARLRELAAPSRVVEDPAALTGLPPTVAPAAADGTLVSAWRELVGVASTRFPQAWGTLRERWDREIAIRQRFNAAQFQTAWDFAGPDYARTVGHGTGRTDEPSRPGEFVVQRRGDRVLNGIYPGGAYTHLIEC